MSRKSFCFVVLSYNHQDYILEHLESIKYQIETFGENFDVQLIINDDASKDNTVRLIELWLKSNSALFSRVNLLFNDANLGTCQSLCNCLRLLQSDYCKLTAGDDVYSCENIFELIDYTSEADVVTAIPVRLIGNELTISRSEVIFTFGMEYVYNSLAEITLGINFINAPNALYQSRYLNNPEMLDFLSKYDVVEDWPIHIFIANKNPDAKFKVVDKCYVYYRRTPGSTYLIASKRLKCDVYKIYDYLLSTKMGVWSRFKLKNRRYCFGLSSPLLKKVLNISLMIYLSKTLLNWWGINKKLSSFSCINNLEACQKYYHCIAEQSTLYFNEADDK